MISEVEVCPDCAKGTLESKEIVGLLNGDYIEIYFYSCDHSVKHQCFLRECRMSIPEIECDADITRMAASSEEKVGNKSVNEIINYFRRNDLDNPEKLVIITYCKYRHNNQTSVFQIIKYEHGELKHIHCKACENSWEYDSEYPIENKFIFEFISDEKARMVNEYRCGVKIQNLFFNATYEGC